MTALARPLLGFDTETHLIDQKAQLPKLVCLSMALRNGLETHTSLIASDTPGALQDTIQELLEDRETLKVNHSVAYDLGVFVTNYPHMFPVVLKALDDEQFSCISIREKLLTLASTGDLDMAKLPDGSNYKLKFSLDDILKKYTGKDLSEEKKGTDKWRTNYGLLDGVPLDRWPEGAKRYPIDDAIHPLDIWQLQEEKRQEMIQQRGIDPFLTESFRLMVDFCLKIMGSQGMPIDPAKVAEVEAMLTRELAPEKLSLLTSSGILRPAVPPQPYKNGATNPDGTPKMTAGQDESEDKTKLKAYVEAWAKALNTDPCTACNESGTVPAVSVPGTYIGCETCGASGRVPKENPPIKLVYTEPSEKFPKGQLSVTADFLSEHATYLDETLKQYQHRAKLQKLVTTEIPRMKLNDVVQNRAYPQYDPLKETGRVSSFASKPTKDKPQTSAQFNCQNVDPRVRDCYVSDPGYLLWSADYSQMELGTLAEVCLKLFGFSVLAEKINAGVDVHAYTGAQLAFAKDVEFQKLCIAKHGNPTPQQIADEFLAEKKMPEGSPEFKHYKHWRKFAKPVNLGYPGGLGASTFVTYAASEQYGVEVTEEEAKEFRELWKQTYPEMVDYFAYINKKCIDPFNKGWDEEKKEEYHKYAYESPYGMHRAGCDYCACSNGLGLQTPSAEGALTALIRLVPACFCPGVNDILGPTLVDGRWVPNVIPVMFIHDEFVGQIKDDDKTHERCMEIKRIMIEAMALVTPHVKPNANVCLMRRWDKAAEPVFDSNGRLNIWEPKK